MMEVPKMDLEQYLANYRGNTRVVRLIHIGKTSQHLQLEALKAAVGEAKRGKDIGLLEDAVKALHRVAPSDPDAKLDQTWLERTENAIQAETARLEHELKGYKNNLIKESIRVSPAQRSPRSSS